MVAPTDADIVSLEDGIKTCRKELENDVVETEKRHLEAKQRLESFQARLLGQLKVVQKSPQRQRSERQAKVADLLREGVSPQDIAKQLSLPEHMIAYDIVCIKKRRKVMGYPEDIEVEKQQEAQEATDDLWEGVPTQDNRRGPKGNPLTWQGRTLTIWQWEKVTGILANTIYLRIKRGWTVERALTEKEHEKNVLRSDALDEQSENEAAESEEEETVEPSKLKVGSVPFPTGRAGPSKGKGEGPAGPQASRSDLRGTAKKRLREKGSAVFLTTWDNNHRHRVKVDAFGDGRTLPDNLGHGHKFCRFEAIDSIDHKHGLTLDEEVPVGAGSETK